jgi:hypothetical protein
MIAFRAALRDRRGYATAGVNVMGRKTDGGRQQESNRAQKWLFPQRFVKFASAVPPIFTPFWGAAAAGSLRTPAASSQLTSAARYTRLIVL